MNQISIIIKILLGLKHNNKGGKINILEKTESKRQYICMNQNFFFYKSKIIFIHLNW